MLCGCWGDRWPMRWKGAFARRVNYAPCLANLPTSSFPTMYVWALALQMVILWWGVFSIFIIRVMKSLFR